MADQPQPAAPASPAPADKAPDPPHYNKQGRLTLAGMRAKHKAGYSVLHEGNVIAPGQPLPTEGDLAAATGDASDLDRARAANEAEIERLRAENQRLKDQARTVAQHPAAAPAGPQGAAVNSGKGPAAK